MRNPKNPFSWGVAGGAAEYIKATADLPRSLSIYFRLNRGKKNRQRASELDLHVSESFDGQNSQRLSRNIDAKMDNHPNTDVIRVTADPHRLKKSLAHTVRSIANDHVKTVLNGVGIAGVVMFCGHEAGPKAYEAFQAAAQNMSPQNITDTLVWTTSTLFGAAAAQHFFKNRAAVYHELKGNEAKAVTKHRTRIRMEDRVQKLIEKMDEIDAITDPDERYRQFEDILRISHKIDRQSLGDDMRAKLTSLMREYWTKAEAEDTPSNAM